MNLLGTINYALVSCGLVGVLMVMMAGLATLKSHHKISNRTGILIIVVVLLGTMIALSVGEF